MVVDYHKQHYRVVSQLFAAALLGVYQQELERPPDSGHKQVYHHHTSRFRAQLLYPVRPKAGWNNTVYRAVHQLWFFHYLELVLVQIVGFPEKICPQENQAFCGSGCGSSGAWPLSFRQTRRSASTKEIIISPVP